MRVHSSAILKAKRWEPPFRLFSTSWQVDKQMRPIHVVGRDSAQEGRGTDTGCSVDQLWEHERSERLRPKAPGHCSVYTEGPEQASPRDRKQSGSCRGLAGGQVTASGTQFLLRGVPRMYRKPLFDSLWSGWLFSKGNLNQEWTEKFLEALSWKAHKEL